MKSLKLTLAALATSAALMVSSQAVMAKEFKMALGDAQGSAQAALGEKFAELLKEKSGGKHSAKLFYNGQLGSEQDTVNDAAIGTLDMSVLAINNVTPFSPTVGILTLPYMIQSLEEAKKLTQGELGEELTKNTIRDAGVRILGWSYTGFRVLTNSKKPVKTLDDLKDLVIRVPKNEIMIETYKSWGINPTPMAWSETFAALQQKVVDGQDNPYITVNSMKFNEVQKYITNIRYLFSLEPLIISESVFKELSEEDQKLMVEAGKEATAHSYQYIQDVEEKIKKELTEKGMEITDLGDAEKPWIDAATKAVWPKFYESIGGKEKLDAVIKSLGRE